MPWIKVDTGTCELMVKVTAAQPRHTIRILFFGTVVKANDKTCPILVETEITGASKD